MFKKFWNKNRLQKADSLGLTPTEIYTLASIVECESNHKPERPMIAGVYLNRIKNLTLEQGGPVSMMRL